MEREDKGWESKLSTHNTKVFAKLGGSAYDSKNPTIKCEWIFDESVEPKSVFEAVSI